MAPDPHAAPIEMVCDSEVVKASRILVVDDEVVIVRSLEAALRRAGYTGVVTATDGVEALELAREIDPDAIILDLHMPSVSGLELLERFNAERNEDDFLPILVLTGDPRPEARLNALLLGARDFVMKPFDPVEVLFRLGNLLQTRHLVRRLRAVGRAVHH